MQGHHHIKKVIIMSLATKSYYQYYYYGTGAYQRGESISSNPYVTMFERNAWFDGFTDAQDSDLEDTE